MQSEEFNVEEIGTLWHFGFNKPSSRLRKDEIGRRLIIYWYLMKYKTREDIIYTEKVDLPFNQ